MKNALSILLKDPDVKVIFFNIFGGITRCDDVANGILQAKRELDIKQPIVARLTGTNEEQGMEILKEAGLIFASTMDEGAKKSIELLAGLGGVDSRVVLLKATKDTSPVIKTAALAALRELGRKAKPTP